MDFRCVLNLQDRNLGMFRVLLEFSSNLAKSVIWERAVKVFGPASLTNMNDNHVSWVADTFTISFLDFVTGNTYTNTKFTRLAFMI